MEPVAYLIAKKMSGTFISKCVRLAIQDLPAGVDVLLSKSVIAWVLIGDWFHGWISSWQTPDTTRKKPQGSDSDVEGTFTDSSHADHERNA